MCVAIQTIQTRCRRFCTTMSRCACEGNNSCLANFARVMALVVLSHLTGGKI